MTAQKELIRALEAIPWFQMMAPEHFNKILGIAKIFKFDAGQIIFHEVTKKIISMWCWKVAWLSK
jgi:predicted choloylglycine hydrolase